MILLWSDETIFYSFAFSRCGGDAVVRYAARVGTRSVPGRARCRRRGGYRRRARGQGDRLGRRRPSDAGDEHLQISAGAGRSGAVGLAGAAAFGAVGSDGRRSVARYVVAVARGASGGRTFLVRGTAALHGGRKRQLRLRPSDPRDRRHRGIAALRGGAARRRTRFPDDGAGDERGAGCPAPQPCDAGGDGAAVGSVSARQSVRIRIPRFSLADVVHDDHGDE